MAHGDSRSGRADLRCGRADHRSGRTDPRSDVRQYARPSGPPYHSHPHTNTLNNNIYITNVLTNLTN